MVQGYDFFKGDWQNVEWLVGAIHEHYQECVTGRGLGTVWEVTRKKIIERRKWEPSVSFYDRHFEAILEELSIMYIPKQMDPGPGVLFPQADYRERYTHGKFHPFYELVLKNGTAKYGFLGRKENIHGPSWLGVSDRVLRSIARNRAVGLVEGPYDLLGCRLLYPDAPVISTGTKSLNEMHILFLRLLGVKTVHLMFDNEPPRPPRTIGAGEQAMIAIKQNWEPQCDIKFRIHKVPNDDPSMCLESYGGASQLRDMLIGLF